MPLTNLLDYVHNVLLTGFSHGILIGPLEPTVQKRLWCTISVRTHTTCILYSCHFYTSVGRKID